VLAADGRVFAFGSGSDGQLGLGRRGDVSVPFLVNFFAENTMAVNKIAAGYYQSAALVAGKLYTWGWGDKGQLGM
jgi:alpha-tubulin suppressor-like RCC1 family protein